NGKAIDRSHQQNELGGLARLAAQVYILRNQIIWNSQLGFYGSPGVYGPFKQTHNHINYEASAVDQLGCASDNESHFYQFPKGIKYCSYELSDHSYFKHHENQLAGLDFNWAFDHFYEGELARLDIEQSVLHSFVVVKNPFYNNHKGYLARLDVEQAVSIALPYRFLGRNYEDNQQDLIAGFNVKRTIFGAVIHKALDRNYKKQVAGLDFQ
ncbi:hypothetical protein ABEF95_000013, partial [Exophiala dermatitidis]